MGKNPGQDLLEGKLTLPLIAALRKAGPSEKARVESILKGKRFDETDFQWVRDFLHEKGGIQYTLEKSRSFLDEAQRKMSLFPDSEEKSALLKLAQSILRRTY
jgi:geranylgeranyl pyrophosphate synthase